MTPLHMSWIGGGLVGLLLVFLLIWSMARRKTRRPTVPRNTTLKERISAFEDHIILLSGPALATSGVIAGIDVLTSHVIAQYAPQVGTALGVIWAFSLMLTLDFQVLTIGVRIRQILADSEKHLGARWGFILFLVLIAAAISFVSIQMGAIFARQLETGERLDQAQAALGINPIALIYERHALVMVLIFMSGFLRDHPSETHAVHIVQPGSFPSPSTSQEWIEMTTALHTLTQAVHALTAQQVDTPHQADTLQNQMEAHQATTPLQVNGRNAPISLDRIDPLFSANEKGSRDHTNRTSPLDYSDTHAGGVASPEAGQSRRNQRTSTGMRQPRTQRQSASPETMPPFSNQPAPPGMGELEHDGIPFLHVPGVAPEKVQQVLSAVLRGESWRRIPGNYTRTIQPVKRAYEAYLLAQENGEQSRQDNHREQRSKTDGESISMNADEKRPFLGKFADQRDRGENKRNHGDDEDRNRVCVHEQRGEHSAGVNSHDALPDEDREEGNRNIAVFQAPPFEK